jgi:hypothetical protein
MDESILKRSFALTHSHPAAVGEVQPPQTRLYRCQFICSLVGCAPRVFSTPVHLGVAPSASLRALQQGWIFLLQLEVFQVQRHQFWFLTNYLAIHTLQLLRRGRLAATLRQGRLCQLPPWVFDRDGRPTKGLFLGRDPIGTGVGLRFLRFFEEGSLQPAAGRIAFLQFLLHNLNCMIE